MLIDGRSDALYHGTLTVVFIVLPFVQGLLIRALLRSNMTLLIIEKRGILVAERLARIIFSAKQFKVVTLCNSQIAGYLIIKARRFICLDPQITLKGICCVAEVQPAGWLLVPRGELRRYIHLFTSCRALHFYFLFMFVISLILSDLNYFCGINK